jgi:hypothetical protein
MSLSVRSTSPIAKMKDTLSAVHFVEEAGDQLGMTPVVLTRTEIVSLSSSRSPRSAMQPGSDAGAERIGRDCHERRGSM